MEVSSHFKALLTSAPICSHLPLPHCPPRLVLFPKHAMLCPALGPLHHTFSSASDPFSQPAPQSAPTPFSVRISPSRPLGLLDHGGLKSPHTTKLQLISQVLGTVTRSSPFGNASTMRAGAPVALTPGCFLPPSWSSQSCLVTVFCRHLLTHA